MTFSWANSIARAKKAKLVRYEMLAIHNKDFQVQHPELVKELTNKLSTNRTETKKLINKEFDKRTHNKKHPPPSVVIKRYNRSV